MSASEKRSLRERLRPKERKPAVRWLLTVLLLAAAVLGLHMLLQMIGTLDFFLTSRHTCQPSCVGSITSSRMMSGFRALNFTRASSPS